MEEGRPAFCPPSFWAKTSLLETVLSVVYIVREVLARYESSDMATCKVELFWFTEAEHFGRMAFLMLPATHVDVIGT